MNVPIVHSMYPSVRDIRACTSARSIVESYDRCEVADHRFFVRLRAAPVDLGAIWVLMANLHESISFHFIEWLSFTISRVRDRHVASMLAKQLNDELGGGDFTKIHSKLLAAFVAELARWRPPAADLDTMAAARGLTEACNTIFFKGTVFHALGALLVGEVFANKMDRCLGDEIRRQDQIKKEALRWLEVHEILESNHADESMELAALLPGSRVELSALRRGAAAQWKALWRFLDEVDDASLRLRRDIS